MPRAALLSMLSALPLPTFGSAPASESTPTVTWPIWSGARADARNSGRCRLPASCQGLPGWSAQLDGPARANAAVDADGNIYVVTDTGLVSFDANGSQRWSYEPGEPLVSLYPPLLGLRGHVFVVDKGGVSAIACADGVLAWRTALPGYHIGPPNVSPNGYLYLGMTRSSDRKGILVCVRPNGKLMWTNPPHTSDVETTHTAPAIASDHTVFVTTNYPGRGDRDPRSMIWAIDFNGFHEWRHRLPAVNFTPVTLTPDNVVLFASYGTGKGDGQLYCLTMMGQTRWRRPIGMGTRSAVAYGLDKIVRVFDDTNGTLYAYDNTDNRWGELRWKYSCGKPVTAPPIVSHDNVTYIAAQDGVIALSPEGQVLWGPAPVMLRTRPILGPHGHLVAITGDGTALSTWR